MATHDLDPADTAMAVLIQPLVRARASGGGLSRTADGEMLVSATWGLGSSIAQGEVTPDRFELGRDGELLPRRRRPQGSQRRLRRTAGRRRPKPCRRALVGRAVPRAMRRRSEIGRLLRRAEDVVGMPVEIEWALDEEGFKLLQARPLHLQPAQVPDEIWLQHPRLNGHAAGVGWGDRPRRGHQLRVRAWPRRARRRAGDARRRAGAQLTSCRAWPAS